MVVIHGHGWGGGSIPVVFLQGGTAASETERLERAAVQRRLRPWHRCGFLRRHVEVLLAPRRSGTEEEKKKMEGGIKKKRALRSDKAAGTEPHYSSFLSHPRAK